MEKLGQLEDEDALQDRNKVSTAETSERLLRSRQQYDKSICEREALFQRIRQVADTVQKGLTVIFCQRSFARNVSKIKSHQKRSN